MPLTPAFIVVMEKPPPALLALAFDPVTDVLAPAPASVPPVVPPATVEAPAALRALPAFADARRPRRAAAVAAAAVAVADLDRFAPPDGEWGRGGGVPVVPVAPLLPAGDRVERCVGVLLRPPPRGVLGALTALACRRDSCGETDRDLVALPEP